MTIHFRCVHCGQKLSVSHRKAGTSAECPKCQGTLLIPVTADSPVPNDPSQWVVDEEPVQQSPWDGHVTIRRSVIIGQGFLMIAVGLLGFAIGMLSRPATQIAQEAGRSSEPSRVVGTIQFVSSRGRLLPDEGAVILVVPADRQPGANERPPIDGLPPHHPAPNATNEAYRTIRLLGGGYARAGVDGGYSLELPTSGDFFVLILSNHVDWPPEHQLNKTDLAQMGRYVLPVTELVGNRRFRWTRLRIQGERDVSVEFPSDGASEELGSRGERTMWAGAIVGIGAEFR